MGLPATAISNAAAERPGGGELRTEGGWSGSLDAPPPSPPHPPAKIDRLQRRQHPPPQPVGAPLQQVNSCSSKVLVRSPLPAATGSSTSISPPRRAAAARAASRTAGRPPVLRWPPTSARAAARAAAMPPSFLVFRPLTIRPASHGAAELRSQSPELRRATFLSQASKAQNIFLSCHLLLSSLGGVSRTRTSLLMK